MILLDTNICVAHLNGDPRVLPKMSARAAEVAVSSLVASELFYGFAKSARAAHNVPRLRYFLATVILVEFDLDCADMAGQVRLHLERAGKPSGTMDVLIAAVALRHDAVLVTDNTRHFQNVPRLKLENWLR
ncbi:MAG: type II toxin-antitoxin system VapC family toxin [Tepidisphaeraceae bacterium]